MRKAGPEPTCEPIGQLDLLRHIHSRTCLISVSRGTKHLYQRCTRSLHLEWGRYHDLSALFEETSAQHNDSGSPTAVGKDNLNVTRWIVI